MMELKTVTSRVLVGGFGAFIALQSLPFFVRSLQNIGKFMDGWQGALGKGIFMGVLGLLIFLIGAWMLKSAIIHKDKSAEEDGETATAQQPD